MIRNFGLLLLFVALATVNAVFAADLNKERAAILRTDKEWAVAASEGRDVNRIVSFWADDATVYPPGQPAVSGKAAIREYVAKSLQIPGFHIQWETTYVGVSPDGLMGYATGTNQVSFNDSQGKQVTIRGKAVTVWRKEPSGEWKCVLDIWNEDAPAPKSANRSSSGDLAGQWRSQVQFESGAFASIKDLEFLYVFNTGGTMTESSNYDAAPPVPPAYGIWRKTGVNQFEAKYEFYITAAPGKKDALTDGWLPAGRGVLSETITLSADGNSFTSSIVYQPLDSSGKPAEPESKAAGKGTRLQF